MSNDSTGKTLLVAAILCIVCSILVSGSAVSLKPRQELNKKLDIKKNLLLASNIISDKKAPREVIEAEFKNIETKIIDLESGSMNSDIDPESYDQVKAAKDPKMSIMIPSNLDLAKIKRREKYSKVFFVKNKETGSVEQIVLPVYGKGLWSTMYGFLSLSPDTKEVKGLGFYQHGETPGLGGEIENPRWTALWKGKIPYVHTFKM